ncbi:MAG: hypothetical protein K2Q45_02360 [Nitrosomonas sp.]|nr:hypothetical protein [Nitrosomonas sp.]
MVHLNALIKEAQERIPMLQNNIDVETANVEKFRTDWEVEKQHALRCEADVQKHKDILDRVMIALNELLPNLNPNVCNVHQVQQYLQLIRRRDSCNSIWTMAKEFLTKRTLNRDDLAKKMENAQQILDNLNLSIKSKEAELADAKEEMEALLNN